MKPTFCLLSAAALAVTVALAADDKPSPTGYSDTPLIPGTQWKVYDIDRPRPAAGQPGDQPGQPPADAIILFDGTSTGAFLSKKKDVRLRNIWVRKLP